MQSAVSVGLPEHVPPFFSSMVLTRVLDFLASPQVLEHDEKLDHVDQIQFSENNMIHHEFFFATSWFQFCCKPFSLTHTVHK